MKKLICLIMCLSIALSVFLPGCSSKSDETTGNEENETTSEKVTLKAMIVPDTHVSDYSDNKFTKWYEEKTNVHIEWDIIPVAEAATKVNLVLSSGSYPDIMLNCNVPPSSLMIYGSQGVFIALNDYIEKFGVNFKKVLQQASYIEDMIMMPDGKIYSLPDINETFHVTMDNKAWIYMPWLEKLGLQMPNTTDEFYQVLKAFKEKDPNGNGKADEIPIAGWNGPPAGIDYFLMNAFITTNKKQNLRHLVLNNGKIEAGFIKPEWKEGLLYARKLYNEGLLAPETFTQDGSQLKRMGENPEIPILGVAITGYYGQFVQQYGESGRWKEYKTVPALKGPGGKRMTAYNPYTGNPSEFMITNNCKNPEIAFKWADYLFSEEGSMRMFWGEEGVEWEKAKPGDVGLNGAPAVWADNTQYGIKHTNHWGDAGPKYISNKLRETQKADPEKPLEMYLYEESKKNYAPYLQDASTIIPPLVFTEDDAVEIADISTVVNKYVQEMMIKFITGGAVIESEWDSYVKNLENMNLGKALKIYQSTYDNFVKNKNK